MKTNQPEISDMKPLDVNAFVSVFFPHLLPIDTSVVLK